MQDLQLLRATRQIIGQQQNTIQRLGPKADAYDVLATVVRALSHQGYGVDEGSMVMEELNKKINELEQAAEQAGNRES